MLKNDVLGSGSRQKGFKQRETRNRPANWTHLLPHSLTPTSQGDCSKTKTEETTGSESDLSFFTQQSTLMEEQTIGEFTMVSAVQLLRRTCLCTLLHWEEGGAEKNAVQQSFRLPKQPLEHGTHMMKLHVSLVFHPTCSH